MRQQQELSLILIDCINPESHALTSSHVQNPIYTFSNSSTNGIGRGDTYPGSRHIRQTKLKLISTSLLYQMACNLSAGAWFGSVRFVIKSRTVRNPWASPGSSPEYSWTIKRWLSSGRNGRLMSDPLPGAALFAGNRQFEWTRIRKKTEYAQTCSL
jgi:hypothetical protein